MNDIDQAKLFQTISLAVADATKEVLEGKLRDKVDELEATIERLCEAAEFDVEDWLERHDG